MIVVCGLSQKDWACPITASKYSGNVSPGLSCTVDVRSGHLIRSEATARDMEIYENT